jgi:hypothetical protein
VGVEKANIATIANAELAVVSPLDCMLLCNKMILGWLRGLNTRDATRHYRKSKDWYLKYKGKLIPYVKTDARSYISVYRAQFVLSDAD